MHTRPDGDLELFGIESQGSKITLLYDAPHCVLDLVALTCLPS